MTPTVSILIPYYNDGAYLKASIQSVLDSTYTDFELILLDHASTDEETVKIAHSFSDPRIKHIRMKKNLGAGSGLLLIEFLKHAKGKYVKLFCADDMMLPDGLETLVNFMENNPDKDFAFGNMEYVDETGNKINEDWYQERNGFNINNNEADELALFSNGVGHLPFPASIVKKECFEQIDVEKVMILMYDMTLWVKILFNGCKIAFIDRPVCLYRISDNQLSGIAKQEEHFRIASFEATEFSRIFIKNVQDISLAKRCFPKAQFIDSLQEGDEEFLPFVIAHYYMSTPVVPWAITGRQEIYNLLSNNEMRLKIEAKFGFGIKEFRDVYRNQKLYNLTIAPEYPNPKSLKLGKLMHLVLRRLYYICFKNLLPKKKKENRYTT